MFVAELQTQIERAQKQQREKEDERRRRRELDRKLIETIPLINEGNAIADELNKPTVFAIKLVANNSYSRSCSQQSLARYVEMLKVESIHCVTILDCNYRENNFY